MPTVIDSSSTRGAKPQVFAPQKDASGRYWAAGWGPGNYYFYYATDPKGTWTMTSAVAYPQIPSSWTTAPTVHFDWLIDGDQKYVVVGVKHNDTAEMNMRVHHIDGVNVNPTYPFATVLWAITVNYAGTRPDGILAHTGTHLYIHHYTSENRVMGTWYPRSRYTKIQKSNMSITTADAEVATTTQIGYDGWIFMGSLLAVGDYMVFLTYWLTDGWRVSTRNTASSDSVTQDYTPSSFNSQPGNHYGRVYNSVTGELHFAYNVYSGSSGNATISSGIVTFSAYSYSYIDPAGIVNVSLVNYGKDVFLFYYSSNYGGVGIRKWLSPGWSEFRLLKTISGSPVNFGFSIDGNKLQYVYESADYTGTYYYDEVRLSALPFSRKFPLQILQH